MWKVILILVLAFPLAFALEKIRVEVKTMKSAKAEKRVEPEEVKEDKFDNWYMGNEKLMQQAKDEKLAKIQKKEAKKALKSSKNNKKDKNIQIEQELEM